MWLFIRLPSKAKNFNDLFESGQLGDADTNDLKQFQRTAWFYTYVYDESSVANFTIRPIVLERTLKLSLVCA